ncbi:DeoR/GlpR family DNA-binding transcription regulator [Streptomyces sp. LHD-70]|uniref:DeoR/GlpR family DNA-binding transcription regulator n=1 Tax=Streptomyces sp. LHD-70 TaxID=3072140 RepID=UPI00280F9DA2|nr:DeoR/GlpR family DNA-binding transcription regulator [Streptomyces sp. LHD-70]MDQ8706109.1 DeoR/GlpR family DNA-binding transcription regulator [Streptomyces sp. LHD-70]
MSRQPLGRPTQSLHTCRNRFRQDHRRSHASREERGLEVSAPQSDGTRWDAPSRRGRILEILDTEDFVSVKDLSEEFGLTEMSVRRDLTAMVNEGLITRVRGGASKPPATAGSPQYSQAASRNAHAKRLIAARAVELIDPGSSLFFYSGTTVARVAASLPKDLHSTLTIATNSLPVIEEVSTWQDPHLVAVGGTYLPSYMTFVGPQAVQAVEGMNTSVAVIGCDGLSADGGLTTPHQLVAEIGATIARQAARTIVVADSSKIGKRGFTQIAPISAVNVLVTDAGADEKELDRLREAGIDIVIA